MNKFDDDLKAPWNDMDPYPYSRIPLMTEVKHTEGPWEVDDITYNILGKTIAAGLPVSEKGGWPDRAVVAIACKDFFASQHEANAHLIAAAPDMEKALEACGDFLAKAGLLEGDPLFVQIGNALNKAKGVEK